MTPAQADVVRTIRNQIRTTTDKQHDDMLTETMTALYPTLESQNA